ncbi:MAG: prepilin peptidase [Lagierella massiliensis]|nr:prepilin peptidase [Lagierella massiliensis]
MICILFVLGTIFGSYFKLVITKNSTANYKVNLFSICDHCHKKLKFYNKIPILSFLFQGGKSSCCNKSLSITYLISEFMCGLLFAILYLIYKDPKEAIILGIFFSLLISMSIIDIKTLDIYYLHIFLTFIISLILTKDKFHFKEEFLFKGLFMVLFLILGYILSKLSYTGFGDILLILSLSTSLYFTEVFVFFLFMALIGGISAIVIYLIKRNRKMKLPFVPIISLSFILVKIIKGMIL